MASRTRSGNITMPTGPAARSHMPQQPSMITHLFRRDWAAKPANGVHFFLQIPVALRQRNTVRKGRECSFCILRRKLNPFLQRRCQIIGQAQLNRRK